LFTLKAVVKPVGRSILSEEKQTELKKFDNTITGGIEEEKVFNNLRISLYENDVKNTVAINGFKEKGPSGIETGEFDFLIVSEPLQTIFHIEVKRTCSKNTADSAAKQLDRGLKLFQDKIPLPETEEWKYVRMMCFGIAGEKHSIFCSECQKYVLGTNKDVWTEIAKTIHQQVLAKASTQTYLNILKYILYEMFKQESCATTQQLINETRKTSDALSTMKNIFFWSKEQLNIIKATQDEKRVALTSEFGTGKTILLKEKAKELIPKETKKKTKLKENEAEKSYQEKINIIFVIFEGAVLDTNLKLEYEKDFEQFRNDVKVIGIQGTIGNFFLN
jgi:hypothetical protein